MIRSKKYDVVVYGATVAGVIYALNERGAGKDVLMINRYGFPGGSITSGLNCLQKIKEPEGEGFYKQFISSLKKDKYGILYNDEKRVLVNPETVKMILQELLVANGVDMLFHVNPLKTETKSEHRLELDLVGKDGIIKMTTSLLLDASENFLFSFIHGRFQPREVARKVNLFTTRPLENGFLVYEGISNYVKLRDGRYWVSLKSADGLSEKEAGRFTPVLHNSGARIQLMPPEIYSRFEFDRENEMTEEPVKTVEEILSKNFLPDEQLVRASEIETHLCG
ncbi:MAG TPA: FAD-dependent oxidoreductase [Ignavibacteriales bacterium]|nr:FAD-dependent oxidoreductase [Ignavibacteriales bacterium]